MPWPWPMPDDNSFRALWDEPQHHDEDVRLAALVAQRLSVDWSTRRQQITVMVQNRVVILTGLVGSAEARRTAGELAWDVEGVTDVCNALRLVAHRRRR
ncbi:BON domain-containing protein [Micromonospora sp. HNM0581]|uniref:BON domain-containing protein n=1 Tax=Micromonospora sp. HNM0581 TaxID=2716341 RepID=UPI001469ABB5|nr:BON domain-containing protein [Micromonospora sp. HNM0581]NLU78361.1 BON domain-containing protein [Micromonospora sp. HNM0581]